MPKKKRKSKKRSSKKRKKSTKKKSLKKRKVIKRKVIKKLKQTENSSQSELIFKTKLIDKRWSIIKLNTKK